MAEADHAATFFTAPLHEKEALARATASYINATKILTHFAVGKLEATLKELEAKIPARATVRSSKGLREDIIGLQASRAEAVELEDAGQWRKANCADMLRFILQQQRLCVSTIRRLRMPILRPLVAPVSPR